MSENQPPSQPPQDGVDEIEARNLEFLKQVLADKGTRDNIASQCEIRQWDVSDWSYFRADLGAPSHPGRVCFEFYPFWLGDWAKRKAAEVARVIYRAWLIAELIKSESESVAEAFVDNYLQSDKGQAQVAKFCASVEDQVARALASQFLFALTAKLRSHLQELEKETCCVVQGWMRQDFNLDNDISEGYLVGHLVRDITTERRQFLKMAISAAAPRWENGRSHFERLLPEATAAKRLYRGNRLRDWRAMVKAGYPDFDADLIDALDPEVTASLRDDYSLPANMALEQSARRCGAKPFSLSPRRIRELIDQAMPPAVAEPDNAE